MEMTIGGEVIDIKIIVEMIIETEGDKILGEVSVMIEVAQGKEAPHAEGMATEDIIAQMQIWGLEVGQIQELLQTGIELDALDVESMITLLMNVQMQVLMT